MTAREERDEPLVGISLSAVKDIPFREMAVRFGFGAIISAIAGLITIGFGARAAGLLLAFPAILPATLTLIEKDESRKKAEDDDVGAVLGALSLIVFAFLAHLGLSHYGAPLALLAAGFAWLVVAIALYLALRGATSLLGLEERGDRH